MLKLNNVSASLSGKLILDSIRLQVPTGGIHVLPGSSGSGKSTLLRLIMGLIRADSGTISLANKLLDLKYQTEWVRNIGYVPQDGGLFPHLTAGQNTSLVAKTLKWTRTAIAERQDELCKVVSLEPSLLQRYPRQLSGGQRQRVALIRAAFLDPQLMLLDEPLGALDPIIRSEVQVELRDIFRRLNKTVVLVTHDINEAAFFAEHVTLLREGRVLQSAPLAELINHPADPFVSRFINA